MVNKKGQSDSLNSVFFLLLLVIMIYSFYLIFNTIGNTSLITGNNVSTKINNDAKALYSGLDFAVPGILLALNIGSLLALFFLKSNPILAFIFMIMIPITIFISAYVSNAFEDIIITIPALATDFPISTFIIGKLPLILFGMDLLGGILLFAVV